MRARMLGTVCDLLPWALVTTILIATPAEAQRRTASAFQSSPLGGAGVTVAMRDSATRRATTSMAADGSREMLTPPRRSVAVGR